MSHLFSIQEEESFWTLNSGTLTLNIEKVDQMSWWEHLVTSDVKINTKKVSPENSKLGGTILFRLNSKKFKNFYLEKIVIFAEKSQKNL